MLSKAGLQGSSKLDQYTKSWGLNGSATHAWNKKNEKQPRTYIDSQYHKNYTIDN